MLTPFTGFWGVTSVFKGCHAIVMHIDTVLHHVCTFLSPYHHLICVYVLSTSAWPSLASEWASEAVEEVYMSLFQWLCRNLHWCLQPQEVNWGSPWEAHIISCLQKSAKMALKSTIFLASDPQYWTRLCMWYSLQKKLSMNLLFNDLKTALWTWNLLPSLCYQ